MRGMWAAAIGAMAVAAAAAVVTQGPPAPRQVRLTLGEGTSMAAALSPDGRTVAIDLLGALWTYAAAGGPARRILEDGYDARLPVWSPDGRRLAFQAYNRDTWHVWIVEADGGGLQQVTFGPFDDREPFWSPDGTRLAFSSDRSGQVRHLDRHARQRRGHPPDDRSGQRVDAGVVARRPRDRLRLRPPAARDLRPAR